MVFDETIMFWGREEGVWQRHREHRPGRCASHGDHVLLVHLGGKSGGILVGLSIESAQDKRESSRMLPRARCRCGNNMARDATLGSMSTTKLPPYLLPLVKWEDVDTTTGHPWG